MTSLGWEFYGLKFSMLLSMIMSAIIVISVWLRVHPTSHVSHTDTMAGDE